MGRFMQKIVLVTAVKEYKLTDKKVNFNKINYTELLSEYQNHRNQHSPVPVILCV